MTTEQRRALADTTPTTEVIKDAVTFPRDRLGEPLDISAERFEAWLARVRRAAWQAGHTTGFEDALLACEIAAGVKPGPPPGPTPNPYETEDQT